MVVLAQALLHTPCSERGVAKQQAQFVAISADGDTWCARLQAQPRPVRDALAYITTALLMRERGIERIITRDTDFHRSPLFA